MAQDNEGGVWIYLMDENNEEVRKFHYLQKKNFSHKSIGGLIYKSTQYWTVFDLE